MSRENLLFPTRSDTNWAVQTQKMTRLGILDLGGRVIVVCTIYVAKTKVLISWTVTTQLICAFVFAYAKSRISNDAAHNVNKEMLVK